jgi:predicted RNA binding protein YcfA (HicA-like mRNA interferase family)
MPKSYSSREIESLIRDAGWVFVRQSGSHRHFHHATRPGIVTIPAGRKAIPTGTLRSIFRQAGLEWPPR